VKEYAFPRNSVRVIWWLRLAVPAYITSAILAKAGGAPVANHLLFFLPRFLVKHELDIRGQFDMFDFTIPQTAGLLFLILSIWAASLFAFRIILNVLSSRYWIETDRLFMSRWSGLTVFHFDNATRAYRKMSEELMLANDVEKICVRGSLEDGLELLSRLREAVTAAGGSFEDKIYRRACGKAAVGLWRHRNAGKTILVCLLFWAAANSACNAMPDTAKSLDELQLVAALLCPFVYVLTWQLLYLPGWGALFRESDSPPWREPGRFVTLLSILVPPVVAACASLGAAALIMS